MAINWVDLILNTMYAIIGIMTFVIIIFFIWVHMQYKFPVRLYVPVANGGAQPVNLMARKVKDKEEVMWYKLQGRKYCKETKGKITYPPAKAFMIDDKGRLCAEGKLMSDGNIEWLRPVDTVKTFYREPLETADRQTLAIEFAKSDERKKMKWWDQHGASTIAIGALVMLIVCCLIFGGDFVQKVMQPAERMSADLVIATNNMKDIQTMLSGIQNDVQYLKTKGAAASPIPYKTAEG